ncbi:MULTISPECIES: hypothetical protein [Stenotrophomonas]|uniref:YrhK domain-containing protein n=1 Tax=Stenotrophomonas nitritireducens TaxID=83617 RepID=A0ABR5NL30_9GAMM|nr:MULTISPECIES: hypothetical protein [Stenotrophomonas]KRG58558.1 hypothetical protein ABB22_06895 [Stenotrophomonas nitritireducens]
MDSIRSLLLIGFVFLANGIVFLIIGLTTQLTVFWALGPSLTALGVAFLAISKSRKSAHGTSSLPGK